MGKLGKGDKVVRIGSSYRGMNVGDKATVKSICPYGVELNEYDGQHGARNLKSISSEFEYGDPIIFTQHDKFRTSGAKGIYIAKHPDDGHIVLNKNGHPLHVKTVGKRTLDGKVREIEGRKYKLKLVK